MILQPWDIMKVAAQALQKIKFCHRKIFSLRTIAQLHYSVVHTQERSVPHPRVMGYQLAGTMPTILPGPEPRLLGDKTWKETFMLQLLRKVYVGILFQAKICW